MVTRGWGEGEAEKLIWDQGRQVNSGMFALYCLLLFSYYYYL